MKKVQPATDAQRGRDPGGEEEVVRGGGRRQGERGRQREQGRSVQVEAEEDHVQVNGVDISLFILSFIRSNALKTATAGELIWSRRV